MRRANGRPFLPAAWLAEEEDAGLCPVCGRIVSDKNYEIRFRFERYEDPLHALNRLLHSLKVPG
jgi:hypothetical protein